MRRLFLILSALLSCQAFGQNTLQSHPTATTPAGDDWLYLQGATNNVRKLSPLYYIPLSYLDTDGTLAANSDAKIASQKAVRTYLASNAAIKSGSFTTGNLITVDGSGNIVDSGAVAVVGITTSAGAGSSGKTPLLNGSGLLDTSFFGTTAIAKGGTAATTAVGALDSLITAEATVASATTTDLGAVTSRNVSITGTTTITGFGTVTAGVMRFGRFTGALTLTHNSTSLILPGAANITTAANDRFVALSLGSGNWLLYSYNRADGTAVVGGGSLSGLTTNGAMYASGSTAASSTGAMTDGQVLIGMTGGAPQAATLVQGANVTITNGAHSITIAASGTGGGGTKTIATLMPRSNMAPASNGATFATRTTGTGGATLVDCLNFDNSTQQEAYFKVIIPEGASLTTGLHFSIWFGAVSLTTGNVTWDVACSRIPDNSAPTSYSTAQTFTATAVAGTLTMERKVSKDVDTVDLPSGIAAGDEILVRIRRATGGLAEAAQLTALEIQYR